MQTERPRIQPILTRLDIALNRLSFGMLMAMWIVCIVGYSTLPDIIPTHYGFDGKADSFGNKVTLWILPGIITLVFALLTFLNKRPHIFNYPVQITAENAQRQYTNATRLLRWIKLITTTAVCFILFKLINDSKGTSSSLGGWFIVVFMAAMLSPIIWMLFSSMKKSGQSTIK